MKNAKVLTAIGSVALTLGFIGPAHAAQDCILEGTVKETVTRDGTKSVYIDFHSAKRYSANSNCRFRKRNFEVDSSVASDIIKVRPGATVEYRYSREHRGAEARWELLQVSL